MNKKTILLLFVFINIIIISFMHPKTFNFVKHIDNVLFDEQIRHLYGRYIARENWIGVPKLSKRMNYEWMATADKPIKIGHALGFSGSIMENRIEVLPQTRKQRLRILEVDLWLAEDGSVRCHHGPEEPGPLSGSACTFERLLSATRPGGEYLVLDIKTDFTQTANVIDFILDAFPLDRKRVIFQLYNPNDIKAFSKFKNVDDYAGPILTSYTSRSSLNDIAQGAKQSGILAIAVPMRRHLALDRTRTKDLRIFVHPVHSCFDFRQAKAHDFYGIYTLASLAC